MQQKANEIVDTVTGIVATHEREEQLDLMLESFRRRYSGLNFVVADNSYHPYFRSDVKYIQLDPSAGISLSRNAALDLVATDYTLLVDDDLVSFDDTTLELLLDGIKNQNYDIVAGNQQEVKNGFDFHGKYERLGDLLFHYVGIDCEGRGNTKQFDVTPNFFIAKTEKLRSLGGWDAKLKFAKEHDDFFLRAKSAGLKVGYFSEVAALNNSEAKHHGGDRGVNCEERFLDKWSIKDKIEVRWIREPFSKLDFYSTLHKRDFQPSKSQFLIALAHFKGCYDDFEVINPYE